MKKTFTDYGIHLTNTSGHERTLCPSCSATRKKSKEKCLSVNIDEGLWCCHHCGYSGCIKKTKSKYIIPTYQPTPLNNEAIKFFKDRKISDHVLAQNNIGLKNNDICFPYIKSGQTVNIKHRGINKKFYQISGAEPCLYRFDFISMLDGPLVITEGEMDALAVQSAGWDKVTSVPNGAINPGTKSFDSAFNFMESAENIINQCTQIILALDDDGPGQAMAAEMVRRIGPEKCWIVEYPDGCKDSNDVLMKYGADILLDCINNAKPCPMQGLYRVKEYEKQIMDRVFDKREAKIKTGWSFLDQHYSPQLGLFTVITGIPGSGKSSFVDNLMLNINRLNNWKFAVFSPENWPIDRHIVLLLQKMSSGRTAEELCRYDVTKGIEHLNDFVYFIYLKNKLLNLDDILAKAKAAVFRYGIKGLVIDPWNEIEHQYKNMSEAQYLAQSLSKIREFVSTNQVHAWIVAHPRILHRDQDGKYSPPTMYQISGGAHWRNKADFGLCLHRKKDGSNITTAYIQKVRFADHGKEGYVDMMVRSNGIFYEVVKHD